MQPVVGTVKKDTPSGQARSAAGADQGSDLRAGLRSMQLPEHREAVTPSDGGAGVEPGVPSPGIHELARQGGMPGTEAKDYEMCPVHLGATVDGLLRSIDVAYASIYGHRVEACKAFEQNLRGEEPPDFDELLVQALLDGALGLVTGPLGALVGGAVKAVLSGRIGVGLARVAAKTAGDVIKYAGKRLVVGGVESAIASTDRSPVSVFSEASQFVIAEEGRMVRRQAAIELSKVARRHPGLIGHIECALHGVGNEVAVAARAQQLDALTDGWLSYLSRNRYGTLRHSDDERGGRDLLDFDAALDRDGEDALGVLNIHARVNLRHGLPGVQLRWATVEGAHPFVWRRLRRRATLADIHCAKVLHCHGPPGQSFRICRDDTAGGSSPTAYPHPGDFEEGTRHGDNLLARLRTVGRFASGRDDRFAGADHILNVACDAKPEEVLR